MKLIFTSILILLTTLTSINAQDKVGNISINYGDEITEEKGKIIRIIGEANNKI